MKFPTFTLRQLVILVVILIIQEGLKSLAYGRNIYGVSIHCSLLSRAKPFPSNLLSQYSYT